LQHPIHPSSSTELERLDLLAAELDELLDADFELEELPA